MQKLILIGSLTCCLFFFLPVATHAQGSNPTTDPVGWVEAYGTETRIIAPRHSTEAGASSQVTCTAAPPTLLTPAEGSTSNDLDLPRYTWSMVPGISEYIFQIAQDIDFAAPLTSENRGTFPDDTEVIHVSFENLHANGTYFWRVASVCADGQIGTFSDPASFQTGDAAGTLPCTIAPPTLLEPAHESTVETLIPNLRWATAENVFEYHMEISTSPTFTQSHYSVTLLNVRPDKTDTTGVDTRDNLNLGTTYYWHVASICADLDTTGNYSAPFSFRTTTDDSNLPVIAPELRFPMDGATTGSIRITYHYTTTADATSYRLEFARSRESAERGDWFRSIGTGQSPVVAVFNPEETLYWWIHARNAFGWGARSEVRMFTTPTDEATADITPAAGGTLQPDPGYLTVTFPPGAVEAPTVVNFHLLATPSQGLPNYSFANRAFSLEATANGEPVTQFAQPYTMVIRYDEGDLLAAGIHDPNDLNLLFWNGNDWEEILPCTGCAIDTTAQTITVMLDHFTDFALVGPPPPNVLYLPIIQRE